MRKVFLLLVLAILSSSLFAEQLCISKIQDTNPDPSHCYLQMQYQNMYHWNCCYNDVKRTVILIEGTTSWGQDMFIRGGLDHDYANSNLNMNCDVDNFECSMPIKHNIDNNDRVRSYDNYLDWYGAEKYQGAVGSPLVWTTNDENYENTVDVDGYGYTSLNSYGEHYWMLDVNMSCEKTVDGWFEFKSFISGGPGWESDVSQSGTPYESGNHFAKCGMVNVFRRGESEPVAIEQLGVTPTLILDSVDNDAPSATFSWNEYSFYQHSYLYRADTVDGEYDLVSPSTGLFHLYAGPTTTWTDDTVEKGNTYFYKVQADYARSISHPIEMLKEAAIKMSQGDLDTVVKIDSGNEFGVLAETFNTMIERLSDMIDKLSYRVKFEQIVSGTSTNFINININKLDTAVGRALQLMGDFLDVDYARTFIFADDGSRMVLEYQWHSTRLKFPEIGPEELPVEEYSGIIRSLKLKDTVIIYSSADVVDSADVLIMKIEVTTRRGITISGIINS